MYMDTFSIPTDFIVLLIWMYAEEHMMLEVALSNPGRADHIQTERQAPASFQVGQLRDILMPNIAYSP
jgi:hypothetical protein